MGGPAAASSVMVCTSTGPVAGATRAGRIGPARTSRRLGAATHAASAAGSVSTELGYVARAVRGRRRVRAGGRAGRVGGRT